MLQYANTYSAYDPRLRKIRIPGRKNGTVSMVLVADPVGKTAHNLDNIASINQFTNRESLPVESLGDIYFKAL